MTLHLPPRNFYGLISQKDAWIAWTSEGQEIAELEIYYVNKTNGDGLDAVKRVCRQAVVSDIGNSLTGWCEWNLADVMYRLFVLQNISKFDDRIRVLKKLAHIKEFSKQIIKLLDGGAFSFSETISEEEREELK